MLIRFRAYRQALALCAAVLPLALAAHASAQDAPNPDEKIDEARAKRALKSADKIEKQVEKLRGLKYQVPVRKGVESEVALKRHLLEETNKPDNLADLLKNEKVARAFGFLPKGFNLAKEEADLLGDQIAGFYDNEGKKLRLVEKKAGFMGMDQGQQEQMDELTMAHELEHALQDQTFDLGRWFGVYDGHADRTEAWKCVVEGEATYVSFVWMFDKQAPGMPVPDLKSMFEMNKTMAEAMPGAKEQQEKLDKLPAWLVKNLTMPYEDGTLFVQKVYDQGGWDAIGKLFRDPPSSTQQVLHPKKYFDRVEPAEISMASMHKVAGDKSKELDRSTWGEFNVRILLETLGVKEKTAKKVAAGWHGDHYQAVELEDGSIALVWLTTWEAEDKAQAFVDTYLPAITKLHGDDATGFSLERKGTEVLLVDCADAKLREKLAAHAWPSGIQDGHVKPLPGFFDRPAPKDFTEVDEQSGFGGNAASAKTALGDRVVDEATGYAARFPKGWDKQAKDDAKGIAEFSKGVWKAPSGAELRVLDFPLPFDKDALPGQLEALAKKSGATDMPKQGKPVSRTVGGHDALEVGFSGLGESKEDGKIVAIERDGVTLAFVVTTATGKLAPAAAALDSVLGTVEFVPSKIKGETEVVWHKDADSGASVDLKLQVAPAFQAVTTPAGRPVFARVEAADGASMQVVWTAASSSDLTSVASESESDRARLLGGYQGLGSSVLERDGLGKVVVSDYEFVPEGGSKRRVRELLAVRGDRRIAVTVASSSETWDKHRAAFERALGTLKIKVTAATPKPAKSDDSDQPEKPAKPKKPAKPEPKKDDANEPF